MRGGEIDGRPLGQSHIEFTRDPDRTDPFTFLTACAFFWIDISGILPHPDLKIAHKSFHFFRFALGKNVNERVVSNFL